MPTRSATATWDGSMKDGHGNVSLKVGTYPYSAKTRMQDGEQVVSTTNPEELMGAAQAACYSMSLSARLSQHGHIPEHIETDCNVTLTPSGVGFKITRIVINTSAKVPDIRDADFQQHAIIAKDNCPISNALAAVQVQLNATLITE